MSLISAPPPLYDQQRKLASDLMSSLELSLPPIAVSFCDHVVPADPQFLDSDALVPLADRVPHSERRSAIFQPVSIRCVPPNRHQYDRMIASPKFIDMDTLDSS